VNALTLAQAKAGLIEAAKSGLIDGSELNESWFQNLRRDVYQAAKKSNKNAKKSKPTPAKQEKVKKTSAVVSGFMKFNNKHSKLEIGALHTVEELKNELHKHEETLIAIAKDHKWLGDDGRSSVKDYQAEYASFGLDENESKAARTWFPYFFTKAPKGRDSGN
jgi:hypothetical protein